MRGVPYRGQEKEMRRFLATTALIFFCFSCIGWIWHDPAAKKNKEGVKLYKEGKIPDAFLKWQDARIDSPDREELRYNIGNALYEQGQYENALGAYEESFSSKNTELNAKTYYNIGNSLYRIGKLPEAIESYEKALDIDQDDEDAKYNIEFIKKKMKQEQEKQDRQQGESRQQQDREESGQGEEEKFEEQKEEDRRAEAGQEGSGPDKEEKNARQENKEGEMSKEDALRILDAMKDDEKDLQKELRIQTGEDSYRVEKDW
jgi:Ca-activated chloride channel homolog